MSAISVEQVLAEEARTMGRDVTLVAAHVFELPVPVTVVVYDCEPLHTARVSGRLMYERRVAMRSGANERASTSLILSTEWREPE